MTAWADEPVGEFFDGAVKRALAYADAGSGPLALSSLRSDLAKHPGTERVLSGVSMLMLFGQAMLADDPGVARRFIQGLPRPGG